MANDSELLSLTEDPLFDGVPMSTVRGWIRKEIFARSQARLKIAFLYIVAIQYQTLLRTMNTRHV